MSDDVKTCSRCESEEWKVRYRVTLEMLQFLNLLWGCLEDEKRDERALGNQEGCVKLTNIQRELNSVMRKARKLL
jgi:hypothetical protein